MSTDQIAPDGLAALLIAVDVHWRDRRGDTAFVSVLGEPTSCEYLVITPELSTDGRYTGSWRLTHTPTGSAVPVGGGLVSLRLLRDVAAQVADLDWSIPEPLHYGHADRPYTERLREAVDRARAHGGASQYAVVDAEMLL